MQDNPFESYGAMETVSEASVSETPVTQANPFASYGEMEQVVTADVRQQEIDERGFLQKLAHPIETMFGTTAKLDPAVETKKVELEQQKQQAHQENKEYKTDTLEAVEERFKFMNPFSHLTAPEKKFTTKSLQGMVRYFREDKGMTHGEALREVEKQGATLLDMADAARYVTGTSVSGAVGENIADPINRVYRQVGSAITQVAVDILDIVGVDMTDAQTKLDYEKADRVMRDEDYEEKYGMKSLIQTGGQAYAMGITMPLTSSIQGAGAISTLSKVAVTEGVVEYVLGRASGHDRQTAAAQAVLVGTTLGIFSGVAHKMSAEGFKGINIPPEGKREQWITDFSVEKSIAPKYRKEFQQLKNLGMVDEDIARSIVKVQTARDGGSALTFEEALTETIIGGNAKTQGYMLEAIDNSTVASNNLTNVITKRSKDMEKEVPKGMMDSWKQARNIEKGGKQATNWMQLREIMTKKGLDTTYPEFFKQVDEYAEAFFDSDMTLHRRINRPHIVEAPKATEMMGGAKTDPIAQTQAQAVQTLAKISPTGRILGKIADKLRGMSTKFSGIDATISKMVEATLEKGDILTVKKVEDALRQKHPTITPDDIDEAFRVMDETLRATQKTDVGVPKTAPVAGAEEAVQAQKAIEDPTRLAEMEEADRLGMVKFEAERKAKTARDRSIQVLDKQVQAKKDIADFKASHTTMTKTDNQILGSKSNKIDNATLEVALVKADESEAGITGSQIAKAEKHRNKLESIYNSRKNARIKLQKDKGAQVASLDMIDQAKGAEREAKEAFDEAEGLFSFAKGGGATVDEGAEVIAKVEGQLPVDELLRQEKAGKKPMPKKPVAQVERIAPQSLGTEELQLQQSTRKAPTARAEQVETRSPVQRKANEAHSKVLEETGDIAQANKAFDYAIADGTLSKPLANKFKKFVDASKQDRPDFSRFAIENNVAMPYAEKFYKAMGSEIPKTLRYRKVLKHATNKRMLDGEGINDLEEVLGIGETAHPKGARTVIGKSGLSKEGKFLPQTTEVNPVSDYGLTPPQVKRIRNDKATELDVEALERDMRVAEHAREGAEAELKSLQEEAKIELEMLGEVSTELQNKIKVFLATLAGTSAMAVEPHQQYGTPENEELRRKTREINERYKAKKQKPQKDAEALKAFMEALGKSYTEGVF